MSKEQIEGIIKVLNSESIRWGCGDTTDKDIAEALYNAGYRKQSENMVEVVRCKDCKHYKPQKRSQKWNGETKYCCRCTVVKVKETDFCSYGAKMKGGE